MIMKELWYLTFQVAMCLDAPYLHSQKRASCIKSAITKLILSGCIRIACSGLMITSLLQVVNRLAAICKLRAGLMQVVSSTSSKSANIKLQQV